MGLVIVQKRLHKSDLSESYVEDITQQYTDGDDHGWGGGTPAIDRADRCLVFFAILIDENGNESYLSQKTQYIGSDTSYAIADGNGLTNDSISKFTFSYSDGHVDTYLLSVERDTTRASGAAGEIYFNTDDSKVYYNPDGSGFVLLAEANLTNLKSASGVSLVQKLQYFEKKICMRKLGKKALPTDPDYDEKYIVQLTNLRNYVFVASNIFEEGKQATARKLLETAEKYCEGC